MEETSERNPSQYHSEHHRSHMYRTGIEPGSPRRETGDWPPESWHGHLQHEVHVNNMYKSSSQLTVNTLHFQYHYVPTNYCCVGFVPDFILFAAVWLRSDVAGRRLAVGYRRFRRVYRHRNVGNQLQKCKRAKGFIAVSCGQYTVQIINMLLGQCRMGGTYSYRCALKGW